MTLDYKSNYWISIGLIILFLFGPFLGNIGMAVDVNKFTNLITISGHNDWVQSVSWSPDGTKIASGSWDYTIKIWNATTGANLKNLTEQSRPISSVIWSPDGSKIVSGSQDYKIKIWNATTGAILRTITHSASIWANVWSVAWSPDGTKIASGAGDGTIKIWNETNGVNLKMFTMPGDNFTSIAWSPDGTKIASGSGPGLFENYTVRIWDIATSVSLKVPIGHTGDVWSIAWSPDGTKIVSGSVDGTIKIWNATTGANLKTLTWNRQEFDSVSWSPDGTKIASGSENGTMNTLGPEAGAIQIWDAKTGKNLETLKGHMGGIRSVAWSPDGTKIASGSKDHTIKIWGVGVPNAYISNISVDKSIAKLGEPIAITATLANNGTANASNVPVEFYDGPTLLTTKYVNVTIEATNTTNYLLQTTNIKSIGMHNLRAVVGKSWRNITVTVNGISNVYVKDMTVNRTNITIGETANISMTIENNGTADGNGIFFRFYDGNSLLMNRTIDVAQGQNVTINYQWSTNDKTILGRHIFKVILGSYEKDVSIIVFGKSNVYLHGLILDRTNLTIGDKLTITAVLMNNGTANATNQEIKFFDGKNLLGIIKENVTMNISTTAIFKWDTSQSIIGPHAIKVVVGNSSKEEIVNIKQRPVNILFSPFPYIMILIIILATIFILIIIIIRHNKR